jgi:hypothetical protein
LIAFAVSDCISDQFRREKLGTVAKLANALGQAHIRQMGRTRKSSRTLQWVLIVLGWALVVAAPLIGWLPGPGGLILFPIGLALVLKNSAWAKRRYAVHSKRHPEYGEWANWAMRRKRYKVRPPFPPVKRDLVALLSALKKRLLPG